MKVSGTGNYATMAVGPRKPMAEPATHGRSLDAICLEELGLTIDLIRGAIEYTHNVLDQIDQTLIESGSDRLASLLELANLSAIVGNLFRGGIASVSNGAFRANRPHTFPDLVGIAPGTQDIEIKVALEGNNPKGHLVKPGPHLTIRYVLADDAGAFRRGKESRGDVVWIWEVRLGNLQEDHFSFSNTEGDSGKTAVINARGMDSLSPVFLDTTRCPHSPNGSRMRKLRQLLRTGKPYPGHSRH